MLLVALTGNYGMGKSTVLHMFRDLGAITLNTDKIVEALLRENDVLRKIRKLLGDKVFDKNDSLNKKKVADIIFRNDLLRHSLEDILHPLVFEKIKYFSDDIRAKDKDKVLIIAAPLIYERGYESKFDRTVVVHTKEENAIDRLEKHGISREEALLRLNAQLPIEEKLKRADFLIDNNGTIEETMAQVKVAYKKLLEEAGDGSNQRS
ncbi:MAG: dephospho-CoA kinase [Nitrospirota bacterium]